MSDSTVYDFEIEYDPTEPQPGSEYKGPWWASGIFDGVNAYGDGATPWEAIGNCVMHGIPRAKEFHAHMTELMERAKAGTACCPRCGVLLPKLTDETGSWFFFCEACRGPLPDWSEDTDPGVTPDGKIT